MGAGNSQSNLLMTYKHLSQAERYQMHALLKARHLPYSHHRLRLFRSDFDSPTICACSHLSLEILRIKVLLYVKAIKDSRLKNSLRTFESIILKFIYPPGSGNLKAKGGLSPANTLWATHKIKQGGRSCESVRIRLGAVIGRANHSV